MRPDTDSLCGPWRLGRRLGQGGMGTVYEAEHAHDGRTAAVKLMDGDTPLGAARFDREVQALERLDHASIVRVIDHGFDPEARTHWLAMERVQGEDLQRRLQGRLPVYAAQARQWFDGLAEALVHSHARGVFHRDIKPANVIVSADDRAVLVDFGIALHEDRTRLTRAGTAVGTPAYMCPELFTDGIADLGQADVYALGVLFWEALTGEAAFRVSSSLTGSQRLMAVVGRKLDRPALELPESWSMDWRDVVRRATASNPGERYPTAASMLVALRALPRLAAAPPITRWIQVSPAANRPAETRPERLDPTEDFPLTTAPAPTATPAPTEPLDEADLPDMPHLHRFVRSSEASPVTPAPTSSAAPARTLGIGLAVLALIGVVSLCGLAAVAAVMWWMV